jgi:hypothetical protein
MRNLFQTSVLFVVMVSAAAMGGADTVAPVFKIYVEHTGVYEVSFERLEAAGLADAIPTAGIGLANRGEPVPVWIEDGGDGVFGAGDRLLFVGESLRGTYSYLDPHSRFNCYVLDLGDPSPFHGETRRSTAGSPAQPANLVARHHLEPDRVMVRFRARSGEQEEAWYWERLSVADKEPFHQVIALEGLVRRRVNDDQVPTYADAIAEAVRDAGTGSSEEMSRVRSQLDMVFGRLAIETTSVKLRLGLRGWSDPRHRERNALPHHEVEIQLNGRTVGTTAWDGQDHHVHEIEIASRHFADEDNLLELMVPKRKYPDSGDLVIDVVLLNWIELEYEHARSVENEQLRLGLADPTAGGRIEVRSLDDAPIDLYTSDGVRYRGDSGFVALDDAAGIAPFSVLPVDGAAAPNEVVLDRPSDLMNAENQADYIMITHRSLMTGAERLAAFHRSRGLTVEVVDVQDIYDEFNYGILVPHAIRDFLQHAHDSWRSPAPRFVLLVGDASWDFKNTTADDANYADWTYRPGENRRFWKNRSTAYAEGSELNHRNLVPTSSYATLEGHAASDTWFVCLDDGDALPDMAIGRLPVVNLEDLDRIIDKIVAFSSDPPVGPWRRNLLFIANESPSFQRRSDNIAEIYSELGYVPTRIYPHPSEPANEHHTQRILEFLDDGVYAVHFIGHGGRYIWRTGPPDLEKNHDLFTLDHLDELAKNEKIPVVLSLTCYSGPFDHPTADSIGEKLVRIPERGAIAVFAASWRNSPSPRMGEILLEELTTPGNTIGEAIMRAKHHFGSQVLVQTYNLLGDPAVPVSAPSHRLDLTLDESDEGVALSAALPAAVENGTLVAEWIAVDGAVLREDRLAVGGVEFKLALDRGVFGPDQQLAGVRVYVWDEETRTDGIGWIGLPIADEAEDPLVAADEEEMDGFNDRSIDVERETRGQL